jgi:carboxymethylenebutenolidase
VTGKVGLTGYCMGGGIALTVAATYPDRVGAVASFHGGNLASDAEDSPHRVVGRIRGTVYVAAAADDPSFPSEQEERLRAAFDAGGVAAEMETYPAAHGFAVRDAPVHDPDAEARHWRALADLYASALPG